MIYTAFYYPGSLKNNDLIVRDNRFYPGKYSETFPVWYQYIRKNYPSEKILMFYDTNSPISIDDYTKYFINDPLFQIRELNSHSGKYFWTMQRNLCEGLTHAYENNEDFFWIDNDTFLNTDVSNILNKCDVFAPNINHDQFTIDSVCTFFSRKKLHDLDGNYKIKLPLYLNSILNNAPDNIRQHTFHEGGLYKLFCYGRMISSTNINISHLSNYNNFMKFLSKNPLDSIEYKVLLDNLKQIINNERLKNVELDFLDMYYES